MTINPFLSDDQTLATHGVLSKRQAREDHLAAKAEKGFDAQIFTKPHNPGVMPAWAKHPPRCRCWDCCPCRDCKARRSEGEANHDNESKED